MGKVFEAGGSNRDETASKFFEMIVRVRENGLKNNNLFFIYLFLLLVCGSV